MQQAYNDLIRAFAAHVGLDVETFEKTQELRIDELLVGLAYDGDETLGDLLYFANLGAPAEHRSADVNRVLLEANYLWAGTGGATLGRNPDNGQVILAGRIDVNGVTAESLAMLLDAFTDTGLYWLRFIRDEPTGERSDAPPPAMLRA